MLRKIRNWIGTGVLVVLSLTAVGVVAQQTPQTPPAQTGFETMTAEDQAREVLPATPFVFTAYAIVWLVLIGYIFALWRRVARVEHDLAEVNARLTGTGRRP